MAEEKRMPKRLFFVKLSTGAIAALTQKEYQEYKKEHRSKDIEDGAANTPQTDEPKEKV